MKVAANPIPSRSAKAKIATDGRAVTDLDAFSLDEVHLAPQDGLGQPVLGDAHVQHASGNRKSLEDHRCVAPPRQVVAGRQAGRSGSYDGHAFPGGTAVRRDRSVTLLSSRRLRNLIRGLAVRTVCFARDRGGIAGDGGGVTVAAWWR